MSETEVEQELEQAEHDEQPLEPDAAEADEEAAAEDSAEPDEAPAEATAAPTLEDKAMEKAMQALDKEATRHANRVSEIMGEDALILLPCPRCIPNVPGFIWPPEQVDPTPEVKTAVKLSLGEGVDPPYKQSDRAFECGKCDGLGKVKTGSRVRGQERVQCPECAGKGWLGPLAAEVAANPVQTPVYDAVENGDAPVDRPESDPWGRLKGDPLYGVMPGFEPE